MKYKLDPIANACKLLAQKGTWLHMDDQDGMIYLAPMVAA